jgi:hypothetical protein
MRHKQAAEAGIKRWLLWAALPVLALCFQSQAQAQQVPYLDEAGNILFADSYLQIPPQYRDHALIPPQPKTRVLSDFKQIRQDQGKKVREAKKRKQVQEQKLRQKKLKEAQARALAAAGRPKRRSKNGPGLASGGPITEVIEE